MTFGSDAAPPTMNSLMLPPMALCTSLNSLAAFFITLRSMSDSALTILMALRILSALPAFSACFQILLCMFSKIRGTAIRYVTFACSMFFVMYFRPSQNATVPPWCRDPSTSAVNSKVWCIGRMDRVTLRSWKRSSSTYWYSALTS